MKYIDEYVPSFTDICSDCYEKVHQLKLKLKYQAMENVTPEEKAELQAILEKVELAEDNLLNVTDAKIESGVAPESDLDDTDLLDFSNMSDEEKDKAEEDILNKIFGV